RKPVISVHTKLMPILFWPTWLTRSPAVRPFFESLTVTSLAVPVSEPSGSPLTRSSAFGTGAFFRSASVMATGAGAAAGFAAWPKAIAAKSAAVASSVIDLFTCSPPPDGGLQVRPIDQPDNPEQAHSDTDEHQHKA